MLLCATPKVMDEMIPNELIDRGFGVSTNIMMASFGLGQQLLSMGMPKSANELATSNYWMVIYGMQIPFILIALYLHMFVFTEEPIDFNVK